jgi:hypothetical protein
MNAKRLLWGAVGLSVSLLAACHDDHGGAPPPASSVKSLDTAQVLTLAGTPSETGTPFNVNDGALVLNDTSETTYPLIIIASAL